MNNKTNLQSFHLLNYLKKRFSDGYNQPFFLATHETYKQAAVNFPIRSFFYGIGVTYSGTCGCTIGAQDYQLQKNSLITIGPGIVSQWKRNVDATSDTVFFTEELFANILRHSALSTCRFFQPGGNHVITVSDEDFKKIRLLFQTLTQVGQEPDVAAGIVYSLLMLVAKVHAAALNQYHHSTSAGEKIASEFTALLATHFFHHKDVGFYAQKLHVTPKYLSEVLLAETGKPAKKIIDDLIYLEAKSLLRQTSMTVNEICTWLGYTDTSYFTKAFKKREGMTPLQYRRQ